MNFMSGIRNMMIAVVIALIVGVGLGYWLHAPPVPANVAKAVADSRAATVASVKADTAVKVSIHDIDHWLMRYDTTRQVDTVIRNSVVYVRADVSDSTARACRELSSTCTIALAAKDRVIAAKDSEIVARESQVPSRLALYGEALYDPLHSTPVARLGSSLRLFGQVSAIAEAEAGYRARVTGDSVGARFLIGGRFTFR